MIHPDRTFCIKAVGTEDDLVEVMTNHKWSLCRAFEYEGFLYLNDGDREETPEYAALKIDQVDDPMVSGREVGRIKPLGIDAPKARRFIQEMRQGRWSMDLPLMVKTEPEWHHGCDLCKFKED
jgi:hypothetical protein